MYEWILDFISVPATVVEPDENIVLIAGVCLVIVLCFFFKMLYKVFQNISLF